jgi:hypothetical protein
MALLKDKQRIGRTRVQFRRIPIREGASQSETPVITIRYLAFKLIPARLYLQ